MERPPVGVALVAIRKRRGLVQREVANLVEVKTSTIGNIETGNLELSDRMLDKLTERLNLTADEVHALEVARTGELVKLDTPDVPDVGPTLAERVAELEARLAALEERFPTTDAGYLMAADADPGRKGTGKRKRRPSPPAQS